MGSVLAKRMPLRSTDFRQILRPNTFLNWKSALRSGILLASSKPMHRPRSDSPPHFDVENTCQIRKNQMLALGVCFPQPCSSAGRRYAASMLCKLDSSEYARSFKHDPTLPKILVYVNAQGTEEAGIGALSPNYLIPIFVALFMIDRSTTY